MNALTPIKPEWAQSKRETQQAARAAAGLPAKRRRWPWLLLVLVLVSAAVAAVAWQGRQDEAVEAPTVVEVAAEPVMQLTRGEVMDVVPRLVQQTVRVTGSLAPQRQAEVAAEVAGRVDTIMVRPGEAVSKGDVLAQIDVETFRIQLEQQRSTAEATRAQLALAESQLARTETLAERGVSSASSLDEAQAGVNQLRASLAALEAQAATAELALENATVTAPIGGIVATRSVDPGQSVAVGASIVSIVDLSTLEVRAFAPVSAGAQIEQGQAVTFTIEGVPGRSFEGRVDRIGPVAAEGTRSIPVYVTLDNPDQLLRGGMFATGEIVVEEQADALALPVEALREDADGTYVLKIDGEQVVRQAVEQERQWDAGRLVEVVSGLSEGDVVVAAALPRLQGGDRIAMVEG